MDCSNCGMNISDAQMALLNNKVYKSCPGCSTEQEEHIFYRCPDDFGTTVKRISSNNPMGLQSHCARCRAGRQGPHDGAIICNDLTEQGGIVIPEIRLLPMSSDVFETYDDAKIFLLETLPQRDGLYYFAKSRMKPPKDTFTLFQYGGRLIAYAILNYVKIFDEVCSEDGIDYEGYYRFFPESIHVFNNPISAVEYQNMDKSFKGFNQSHQKRPVGVLPLLWDKIDGNVESIHTDVTLTLPEELNEDEQSVLLEGQKKQITVNAYERNPEARRRCLEYYKRLNHGRIKCEVCDFDFGKVYGGEFEGKIHIHHLKEISSIGAEYEIDAEKDLIPICPNCHMVVHSRRPAMSVEELKKIISALART